MRDLLPEFVLTAIRDRYIAGVANAEAAFKYGDADEDSLTGALGQAISTPHPIRLIVDDHTYDWTIYSLKIRGRGPGAPEKRTGADGIFQIEITDADGSLLRRKGLPFQAKKGWSTADRTLVQQTRAMLELTGDGIVIDYTSSGYTSCHASAVIAAHGRKRAAIRSKTIHSLGQTLGVEFLDCKIGKKGLFYDPETENFVEASIERISPDYAITTSVHTSFRDK